MPILKDHKTEGPSQEDYDEKFNEIVDGEKSKEQTDKDFHDIMGNSFSESEQRELDKVAEKEGSATEDEVSDIAYSPESKSGKGGKERLTKRFVLKYRKQALVAAAAGSAGIIGWVSFISGPGQFIHAAQLLQQFHFSSGAEATDSRTVQLWRFLRDPTNPQNRRLGELGKKWAGHIDAYFADAGITMGFSRTGNFRTIDIDPEKYGKNVNQIQDDLKRLGVKDAQISVLTQSSVPGLDLEPKALVTVELRAGQKGVKRRFNGHAVKTSNLNNKASYAHSRVLNKRAGVGRFNFLGTLDDIARDNTSDFYNKKKEAWKEKRRERIKKGGNAVKVSPNFDADSVDDGDGGTRPAPGAEDAAATGNDTFGSGDSSTIKSKLGTGLKITGSITLIGTVGCLAQSIGENVEQISYENVSLPLIRSGMELIVIGNQIMVGENVDLDELGYHSELFFQEAQKSELDYRDDVKASGWTDARSIQHELGEPTTGPDIPPEVVINTEQNMFTRITGLIPGLSTFCDASSSIIGQVVLTGIDLISGPISGSIGAIAGYLFADDVIDAISDWAADDPIDLEVAGADYGNYVNVGARLAANEQALSMGGAELTGAEVTEHKMLLNEKLEQESDERGFAYRWIDKNNPRSFVSTINRQVPSSAGQVANSIISSPGKVLGSFSNLIPTSQVFGQTVDDSFDYGFPKIGFSLAELEDEAYEHPYQNAASFSNERLDELRDEWGSKCFGIKIDEVRKTFEQEDGRPLADIKSDCPQLFDKSLQTQEFMRYRFYILDTVTMMSLACYAGDEAVCQELGFSQENNSEEFIGNPNIYLIGDSLSVGLRQNGVADLVDRLQQKGWQDVCVEAEESRALGASELTQAVAEQGQPPLDCRGNTATKLNGLNQINQAPDKPAIENAGTVVVALGTNDGPTANTSFRDHVTEMIGGIRSINPNVRIYWVNTYAARDATSGGSYKVSDFNTMNDILDELSQTENFTVLDWHSEAPPHYSDSDPIHPNPTAYADFIAEALGSPSSTSLAGVSCPTLEPHGSQEGYYLFPEAPNGEYEIYSTQARRYGSDQLVCVVYSVALAYHGIYGEQSKLWVGDLNAGAPHKSHYKGVAVDLDAGSNAEGAIAAGDWTSAAKGTYSTEATIALGKLFIDTGVTKNIWWCEPTGGDGSIGAIRSYAESVGNPVNIQCIEGHANHFHVDIDDEFVIPGSFTP